MDLKLFSIVRTRTYCNAYGVKSSVHTVRRTTPSLEFAEDLLEELYDTVLPEKYAERGFQLRGYDWWNDHCFEFAVHTAEGEWCRLERFQIVASNVDIQEHV